MLGESTARLVEDLAMLADPQVVALKGSAGPVRVRRLLGFRHTRSAAGRIRRWSGALGR